MGAAIMSQNYELVYIIGGYPPIETTHNGCSHVMMSQLSIYSVPSTVTRANYRYLPLYPQIHQRVCAIHRCAKSDVHVPLVESNIPSGVEFPLFGPFEFAMHKRFKHTVVSRFGASKSMEKTKSQGGVVFCVCIMALGDIHGLLRGKATPIGAQ